MIVLAALCYSAATFAETPPADPAASEPVKTAPVTPEPVKQVPVVPPAPSKPMGDMDLLKEQIKRLEDKLTKMEEENDIRRRLETTEEEKTSSDEAILSAAGRDYTLMKPGRLGFEYSIGYSGSTYDSLDTTSSPISAAHNAQHTVTNTFFIEYPVKENLTVNSSIPFVYKYNSTTSKTAKDVNDFGDVSFGFQFQPVKSGGDLPSLILSGALTCPTGRSPYKIDSAREMSSGGGLYSLSMGCNLSKSVDPLVAFGGLNVEQGIKTTHLNYKSGTQGEAGIYLSGVDPGATYSVSMGIGYSLSYKTSLTLSYQFAYQSKTRYDWVGANDSSSEGTISSVFSVGTGWTLSPKRSVNVRLGIGLTNNDSDFSLQVRVPFEYEL
jgi:hypothetical protein